MGAKLRSRSLLSVKTLRKYVEGGDLRGSAMRRIKGGKVVRVCRVWRVVVRAVRGR